MPDLSSNITGEKTMKKIAVREFKDLTSLEQKQAQDTCINDEVEFCMEMLGSDLEQDRITEEEFWKEIGCSKSYGESTPWFVGSVYYDHHKKDIEEQVGAQMKEAVFNSGGRRIYP
jgi:hypothetical protein